MGLEGFFLRGRGGGWKEGGVGVSCFFEFGEI